MCVAEQWHVRGHGLETQVPRWNLCLASLSSPVVPPGNKDPSWNTATFEALKVACQLKDEDSSWGKQVARAYPNDHAFTSHGTSYTPGDLAFLTTWV